jgi:hypothetical protein
MFGFVLYLLGSTKSMGWLAALHAYMLSWLFSGMRFFGA